RVSARTGLRPAPGLSLRASQCGDHLVAGQRRELEVSRVRGQRVDREPSGLGDLGKMADDVVVESIRQPLVADPLTDNPMVGLVRVNCGERAQGPQPLPTQAEPELLLDLSDDGLLSGLARLGLAAGEHERSGARLADHEQLPAVRVEQDERGDADVVHADHTPEAPRRWESSRCVSTIPMASMSAY